MRAVRLAAPFTHTLEPELQTWKSALTDPKGSAIPANLYFPDAAKNVVYRRQHDPVVRL